jgi:beta-glucanase (GH16 family)
MVHLPDPAKWTFDFGGGGWGNNELETYTNRPVNVQQKGGNLVIAGMPAGDTWVFDHPFFILLNIAVGGDWPGSPDATTTFPQQMVVDYVRVYKKVAD